MAFQGSGIFRSLTDEEENQFRSWAQKNAPEDLAKWEIYHPVCRQEWERRGIHPNDGIQPND